MARTTEREARSGMSPPVWQAFLELRPTFALAAAWLTTAGHTMNFREMDAARGWVTAVGYSLHTIYLVAIILTLLTAPHLARRIGGYWLVVGGMLSLLVGSAVNGLLLHAPGGVLEFGRVLAGIGSGLVIHEAPRLNPPHRRAHVAWAGIVLPAMGPVVLAYATYLYGWHSWEGGFLFEGVLAVFGLAMVLSISDPPFTEREPGRAGSWAYLPFVALGAISAWYVMHWGQLHGWLESPDIAVALLIGVLAFNVALWTVWPYLDVAALRTGFPRIALVVYGGFVQYFNVSDMGVYGGLLVNFGPWMRSWLVWSLSVGAATALAAGRIVWRGRSPGYGGATFGLLVLAAGMALSHHRTLNWPFWSVLNTVEFNWFAAPQHWQLAAPRFLMGFGSGLLLLSMTADSVRDLPSQAALRPFLAVAQFTGGALGIGALVTILLVGHSFEYSYTSDRGYIQAAEQADRRQWLIDTLTTTGHGAAEQQSDSLLFRAVNYEADNLVFARIYGGFCASSLTLAAFCLAGWFVERRRWEEPRPNGP
ncbi:MAG: hypothetical protein P4L84_37700 [Isosphaeraceae bacterium]|nr:hypothetical protein [Isosphaeraceae bacterium]